MKIKEFSYSLIIPTRNRHKTAIYAIQSALNCNYKKLQIVISDNSDNDDLYHTIKKNGWLECVTYHKTDKVLSMRDNWEKGIDLSTGEILSIIGDDDAIMPDAYIYANIIFSRNEIDVFYPNSATYKWDCYPLPGRQHYISVILGDKKGLVNNPKNILKAAINYDLLPGTGPGIYYGFVKKEFLNTIKKKRGRWFIDDVPDFDSGYATLMYAKNFATTTRPLFISGHSGESNSGSMRSISKKLDSYLKFEKEMQNIDNSLFMKELDAIKTNNAVIVSAQHRILKEIRSALNDTNAKINQTKAWDYILEGFSTDYDNLSILTSLPSLKKLAKTWNVKDAESKIKEKLTIKDNPALIFNQGFHFEPETQEKNTKKINKKNNEIQLTINGQQANVKNIIDVTNLIQSLLPTLARASDSEVNQYYLESLKKNHKEKLELAIQHVENSQYTEAESLISSILNEDSNDVYAHRLLAITLEKQEKYSQCVPVYARSFSLSADLKDLENYLRTMLLSEKPAMVIDQIQKLSESDPSLPLQEGILKIMQQSLQAIIKSSTLKKEN